MSLFLTALSRLFVKLARSWYFCFWFSSSFSKNWTSSCWNRRIQTRQRIHSEFKIMLIQVTAHLPSCILSLPLLQHREQCFVNVSQSVWVFSPWIPAGSAFAQGPKPLIHPHRLPRPHRSLRSSVKKHRHQITLNSGNEQRKMISNSFGDNYTLIHITWSLSSIK